MSAARILTEVSLVAASLALGLAWMGCSAIGDPGGTADGLPHGGTGEFRFLSRDETGVTSSLEGRAIVAQTGAIGSAMATPEHLYYAFAPTVDEPPMPPEDHPEGEIFEDAFLPSAIHLGPSRELFAYDAGAPIFEASQPWQGEGVFDPWMLPEADGSALLYYAAEGGIGLAEAGSPEGPFTAVGDGPIVGADGGPPPRRPTAVRMEDGSVFLYFEVDGALALATSDDGRVFTRSDELAVTGEDETASAELGVGGPGALALETSAGRVVYRLYFESRRENGARLIYVAGSSDGLSFERHPRPVMESLDARAPAPLALDGRRTLLFVNQPLFQRGLQTRAVSVAVSPGGISLAPETTP